jgi:predicted transcriptional regulator
MYNYNNNLDDNMIKGKTYKFNQQDKKIIEVFTDLGMPKNLARTLMYISQVDECRSSEIERGSNLRQPEVSVAMQRLQKKGWIEKRDLRKKGKGRPVHLYRLASPLDNILSNFEKEKTDEIESTKKDLIELKSLIESI